MSRDASPVRELVLPWPDRVLHNKWSQAEDDALLAALDGGASYAEIADASGRSVAALRNRAYLLGATKPKGWSDDEVRIIQELYSRVPPDAKDIARQLGRSVDAVEIKASRLGLGDRNRRKKRPEDIKPRRKFATLEEARAHIAACTRERIKRNGHPRGALGLRHTDKTKARISEASIAAWNRKSPNEQQAIIDKAISTRVANGTHGTRNAARGTWLAGWREVGGKRNYYRSRWEANYARYLQWLKERGEIEDWRHEPETFWFESIKRGVRSYKPDFRVWEIGGASALHEVKGWMDTRSKTCISRMAKFYPNERLIVIDGPAYRAIRRAAMPLIPGWEDSPRDTHA